MRKAPWPILILLFIAHAAVCQPRQAYFADGYHGGIYGHYPMWNTQFMADKLHEYPLWKINLEIEPATWDTVRAREPQAYENFKRVATGPRVEFTNPSFAQPYLYNTSGESMIRHFQYGMRKVREHFPGATFTTYSAEEPCFTSSLPRILRLLGFKYAVLKNPDTCWGGYTSAYGGELVNWVGPDGTKMLTVPRYECEELEKNSTWQTAAWRNSADYFEACFDYGIKNPAGMCFQDAGWRNGPWIGDGRLRDFHTDYITWTDYIENVSVGQSDDDWHFSQEDVRVALMWGSQVLQRIGQQVRRSENMAVLAEKMSAMAAIEGRVAFPQQRLDSAWRTIMLAQHHDSWIVPYNGLNGRTWAQQIEGWTTDADTISQQIISNATAALQQPDRDSFTTVRVFNPVAAGRTEQVRITLPEKMAAKTYCVFSADTCEVPSERISFDGQAGLVFTAAVPSFGYATFTLKEKPRAQPAHYGVRFDEAGDCVIENELYRIVVDPKLGGRITSLVAKQADGKDFAAAGPEYGTGDIRGYFYRERRYLSSADSPARITVLEDTPLGSRVMIEGHIGEHPFMQTIWLAAGKRTIDFDLKIYWQGDPGIGEYEQDGDWRSNRRAFYDTRYMLNVMLPSSLGETKIYKDAPFDVCESKLKDTFFGTWDSIKHNVVLHWVDATQPDGAYGLALFSDHTTSYSHGAGFPLALTVQYSGRGLWGRNYGISGPTRIGYSLMPHKGWWADAGVALESAFTNEPMVVGTGEYPLKDKSFIDIDAEGYEVSAAGADDKMVTVRLFNAFGDASPRRVSFGFEVEKIEEVDLNGEVISQRQIVRSSDRYETRTSLPRFGIETLRLTLP